MKRNKKKPTRRGNCMTFNDKKNQVGTNIRRYQLRPFFLHTKMINKQLEKKTKNRNPMVQSIMITVIAFVMSPVELIKSTDLTRI